MKDFKLKISGKKVYLRYVNIDDCAEVIALNQASVDFYKGLMTPLIDAEVFRQYTENNQTETNESFVICQNNDDKIVGSVNLSQIFRKSFQNCYLGYSLGKNYTGNGFMTEAVYLVISHAFQKLKLHRIEANVQPHNYASIKVLQRCGFTKEGFSRKYLQIDGKWCDHQRWAITVEDWQSEI